MWPPASEPSLRAWAEEQAAKRPEGDEFRLQIETVGGDLVGTINSNRCDRRNGHFSYGIYVQRESWGNGYATEAIVPFLRYFFGELRYQKVTVNVYAYNERSIALHRKLGFVEEGRLRSMEFHGGRYHEELYFGMLADEFWERFGRSG